MVGTCYGVCQRRDWQWRCPSINTSPCQTLTSPTSPHFSPSPSKTGKNRNCARMSFITVSYGQTKESREHTIFHSVRLCFNPLTTYICSGQFVKLKSNTSLLRPFANVGQNSLPLNSQCGAYTDMEIKEKWTRNAQDNYPNYSKKKILININMVIRCPLFTDTSFSRA